MSLSSLQNNLLIAMPGLHDTSFARTVIYLCTHSKDGALGLIINKPINLNLNHILSFLDIKKKSEEQNIPTIFRGGPVEKQRGFVLHPPGHCWDATLDMNTSLSITTSRDVLEALACGEGPSQSLVVLGYTGWQAGQLEKEMRENIWLNCSADNRLLFETPPSERWQAAGELLNIDVHQISCQHGHA
jgi:putative transcriptional regulator